MSEVDSQTRNWVGIAGELTTLVRLTELIPGLKFREDGGVRFVWEPNLLVGREDNWRSAIQEFIDRLNCLLFIDDPYTNSVVSTGSIVRVRPDGRRDRVLLIDSGIFELSVHSITLSARGGSGRQEPRSLHVRALELASRLERFRKAGAILAKSGDNFGQIFMAAELIEKAHGGLPSKNKALERAKFFARTGIDPFSWEALHRSARPARHAEPHIDGGPTISAKQAKLLVHHALKAWVEREVPV